MTAELVLAVLIAAVCGVGAAGLYLTWPRRLTAEEYALHRRALSAPPVQQARPAPPPPVSGTLDAHLERIAGLVSVARVDLALLRLAGRRTPADERELARRLVVRAAIGGTAGLAFLGLLAVAGNGLEVSAFTLLLPVAGALLWPAWSWLSIRREAGRVRSSIEQQLPRLLIAARVLLESGAATPEGALNHAIGIYEDPAADLIREALLAREVRRVPLEAALDDAGERYGVTTLTRLADSFRVGVRYGTRMAELLGEQSMQLRRSWFAAYRERITRAPILLTIPALLFFVGPLLLLIFFLVFTPLIGALGQL